jgi:hypothetical protein
MSFPAKNHTLCSFYFSNHLAFVEVSYKLSFTNREFQISAFKNRLFWSNKLMSVTVSNCIIIPMPNSWISIKILLAYNWQAYICHSTFFHTRVLLLTSQNVYAIVARSFYQQKHLSFLSNEPKQCQTTRSQAGCCCMAPRTRSIYHTEFACQDIEFNSFKDILTFAVWV